MKRSGSRLTCLLVVLSMLLLLATGCSQGIQTTADVTATTKASQSVTTNSMPKEKVKIVRWTMARHDMDLMNAEIASYNKDNKDGVEVEYVIQTENYAQNLELAFQSGQAPDIFNGATRAKYYVDRSMAAPIDGFMTEAEKSKWGKYLNVDMETTVDGKLYTLPMVGVSYRLVYNKDLFKKAGLTNPPKTLAEMVEYAQKITLAGKAEGAYGFAMNLKNPASAMIRSMEIVSRASNVYPYNFKTGKYEFTGMKPIIEAFKRMYADGSMFPGVEGLDIDPLRAQFANGKIGMYMSKAVEVGVYKQQFPTKVNWGAAPVPTITGELKGKSAIELGSYHFISSKSKNKELAWKAMSWQYDDQFMAKYHEGGYGFILCPTALKIAKDPDAVGAADFKTTDKIDGIWPIAPHEEGIKIEGKSMYDTIAAVILNAMTVDDAIKDMDTRYNAGVDQAVKDGKLKLKIISDFDPLK